MSNKEAFNLSSAIANNLPFPHFNATSVLINGLENEMYSWFQSTTNWDLVETDFYEQYEFSLLNASVPDELAFLISAETLNIIKNKFKELFKIEQLELVDIVAHKLINSQHIGVHNDYIYGMETHRLVLHINPHWQDENGGFLLLFNSFNSSDIAKVIKPINNSVFGFEISKHSHHAVSKIHDFIRYTIVYTFKLT